MMIAKKRNWAGAALYYGLFVSAFVLVLCVVLPRLSIRAPVSKIGALVGADIAQLSTALNNFKVDCSRFPSTAEGLQALMEQPPGVSGWKGPYLRRNVPQDPFGNAYVYRCPGDHNKETFDLFSCGPSGQEGGADNIDNWTIKPANQ